MTTGTRSALMKVLLINTNDIRGGAARAAYRLLKGLQLVGLDSKMLSKYKKSSDPSVICHSSSLINSSWGRFIVPDMLPLVLYPRRKRLPWSTGWLQNDLPMQVAAQGADLVHLHWVGKGFMSFKAIPKFDVPLVWTLHDMWAFTGGCHYSADCTRYTESCGSCPQLRSKKEEDLSRKIWRSKERYWEGVNLTVVAPSKWLADCALASSLFRDLPVRVIPNGLDTLVFSPKNREAARKRFGLHLDRTIILAGAVKASSDERKGFRVLGHGLKRLAESRSSDDLDLVVFGEREPARPPDMGFKVTFVGEINDDDALALLYSAADVYVAPSTQENLANTVMEAMACGTPVVAFDIGGMSDMIEHEVTGYLAQPFDTQDLARGISWVTQDRSLNRSLSCRARAKVEKEYAVDKVGRRYAQLYEEVLKGTTL
jgi:glycosyltransferase involved in cell wall biosynthesis